MVVGLISIQWNVFFLCHCSRKTKHDVKIHKLNEFGQNVKTESLDTDFPLPTPYAG